MIRNRLYYSLKPIVPWSIRIGVRRWIAGRKRHSVSNTWPILPGSEVPPANWPGWPGGKKFAFVLTHDVEGPEGLEKCRRLAELEMSLGFRSSFNFIPEGSYQVPKELREWLVTNGFEVGVHDLKHDGKLYRSLREFKKNAALVNRYLKDWGAAGFRSGFMLNELEWLHDLNIQYDASTFDTDPFEPQPNGQNTIFPFWVDNYETHPGTNGKGRRGYVELPYTLPQDSTLYLLLRESSPDIWLKKLDWVAQNGGMALINVHPDYVRFEGETTSEKTFPIEYYTTLLKHVRDRYQDTSWQVCARDVAAWVRALPAPLTLRRKRRICMVTHSHYTRDNRVIRYAEALAARGDHVDVFGLRGTPDMPREEQINGVHLVRLQDRFAKTEESGVSHLWPILRFFSKASWEMTRRHARQPYDLCHIHNIPDFLVFVAWYPRLRGAKIILDIHDIVPEFFSSKFGNSPNSPTIRGLLLMERWSAGFAHHVIIANHLWLEKYVTRSASPQKCSVFINNVDSELFQPQPRSRQDGKLIVMFPGGLQWHQGLDIGLRAFEKITREFPQAEFHIYGDGNMKDQLVVLAGELGLNGKVKFFAPRRVQEIARVMADADLGVVPKRADSFGNEAYSTKIMEFMSVGVPVVVSETKIDRYYFNDSVVRFFQSGNVDAMAVAMGEILRDQDRRNRMISQASQYATEYSWASRKGDYLKLVDGLCFGK
jgi:glycosyltransferase involved in cell wall biosynthesis